MSDNTGPQSAYSVGAPRRERADAARNRARILDAAERLFHEHGVDSVSMDQLAQAAQVGKGTLFRRFGDKAGLAVALLDSREARLQAAVLSGPPPLGPGAPPAERLTAFLTAYADFLDAHLDLLHMSETARPGARYRIGSYRLWHRHVEWLLGQARPDLDATVLAHALLAPLAADQRMALRDEVPLDRLRAGVTELARSVLAGR
ncbi:helix-turn-helix domain-containing protein [Actinophytocola sp.]|jgi:AcrR family transcriptional regulator|uniref:TetR/AcrR family transcriptional regulator n=1 Tax=Actinophytocola sp. TaxID=1872138 RepID=UPI002D80CA07|nr:helix-turn-helix domain-containing protein [Actinophytocola sp.]HET9141139.1 helix-turn-helix domain-containing protein [Actinophytocola sp.]